jgi:Ca2+-binding RTX toxin-like protein
MNLRSLRRAGLLGLAATGLAATLLTAGPAHADDSASASVVGRTLHIEGTGAADVIALGLDVDPNTLLIRFTDGTIEPFDRTTFDSIDVALRGGDDRFTGGGIPMSQTSRIDGGGGDDVIFGTAGDDVINGRGGNDAIVGGSGNDVAFGGGGSDFVAGGIGHDTSFLGGGNDTFLWNPGEGSDDTNGGGGRDTLLFNGANVAETMSLSAVGHTAVFLRNPGNVVMNNDAVEVLDLHALGGADQITVNDVIGTDMREADIDLSAAADGGAGDTAADLVTVNGTDQRDLVDVAAQGTQVDVAGLQPETLITGSATADGDHLQVNTLDGNDRVTVDPNALVLIGVTADLGAGQI